MEDPVPTRHSAFHVLGDQPVPVAVESLAGGLPAELVWRNELGGLTFRIGNRYLKWNPHANGIDLERERVRLVWLRGHHPVPEVLDSGFDAEGQWLVTSALPGEHAVGMTWRARPADAVRAIAEGLRVLHAVPVVDFPKEWIAESWVNRSVATIGPRPPVDHPVLVHGDACAPNTLISATGQWIGNVDFGALTVGDRWADLAVASMSLDWNFGEGHQADLFEAYGTPADEERIRYYRALWDLES